MGFGFSGATVQGVVFTSSPQVKSIYSKPSTTGTEVYTVPDGKKWTIKFYSAYAIGTTAAQIFINNMRVVYTTIAREIQKGTCNLSLAAGEEVKLTSGTASQDMFTIGYIEEDA